MFGGRKATSQVEPGRAVYGCCSGQYCQSRNCFLLTGSGMRAGNLVVSFVIAVGVDSVAVGIGAREYWYLGGCECNADAAKEKKRKRVVCNEQDNADGRLL